MRWRLFENCFHGGPWRVIRGGEGRATDIKELKQDCNMDGMVCRSDSASKPFTTTAIPD
jgi:hypothetical protein